MPRLLLIDGSYYAYRSFHAIRELSNSAGDPVNALFGFAKALRRMLKDLKPDLAACVWDGGLPARAAPSSSPATRPTAPTCRT